jgi:FG-GAP repeat
MLSDNMKLRRLFVLISSTICACKINPPSGFLDGIPDTSALLASMNVKNGGELWSGVVTGTLPDGVAGVDAQFDGGDVQKTTVTGSQWKVFIPTGTTAAAGTKRWQVGSKHSVSLRAHASNGNRGPSSATVTFTRQMNRDVNADGYADVAVGSQNDGTGAAGGQTVGAGNKGAAYVYYGSSTGIKLFPENGTAYYCAGISSGCAVIQNPDNSGSFGVPGFAGDVNGDGYGDIIVGASGNNGTNAAGGQTLGIAGNKGAAYVFYGSANGITLHPENSTSYYCGGAPDCTVIQNPDNFAGRFGSAVSGAGDVNGDGYADVIVGAYQNQGTNAAGGQTAGAATNKGAAYVFYGSATGITLHAENATAYYCSGFPDCTVVQNPDQKSNGNFGASAAFAGDVNGDGYADVTVSAYQNDGTGAAGGQTVGPGGKGANYIFYGSSAGITLHPENATAYYCSGFPDCTVVQNPDQKGGNFGYSTYAGDVNADSYADIVTIAAYNDGTGAAGGQTLGASDKGAMYVFYGSASGIKLHPENTTAYYCSGPPDCTVMQNPDNNTISALLSDNPAHAGDVNGDGYADVIMGAYKNDGNGAAGGQSFGAATDKGAAYIFYGSATGTQLHPLNSTPYYCSGPPDCTVVQNPDQRSSGAFAFAISPAGDTNGDGYADVHIGAWTNDGTNAAGGQSLGAGANKGASYVFYGSSAGIRLHPENTTAYYCSGPSGNGVGENCTVMQNPDQKSNSNFGINLARVQDTYAERSLLAMLLNSLYKIPIRVM